MAVLLLLLWLSQKILIWERQNQKVLEAGKEWRENKFRKYNLFIDASSFAHGISRAMNSFLIERVEWQSLVLTRTHKLQSVPSALR